MPFRSEMVWKKLGKDGTAVHAPWPVAGEVDKILARQAKLLRDSLKQFRTQVGKAKKGWEKASIVVADEYPQWKVDILMWMQSQYDGEFAATFMKDLKGWTGQNLTDKKMIKFAMQFASFRKKEVEDVGESALDIKLPFDESDLFAVSIAYMKSQLNLPELEIVKLREIEGKPPKNSDNIEPGKPSLWLR